MRTRLLAIGTALALASQLASCSVSGEAGSFGGTGESRAEHPSDGGDLTVRLSITVDRGEIGVRIVDPSGDERFVAKLRAGESLSDSFRFRGERGLWVVEFALPDAGGGSAGAYEVEWSD